MSEFINFTKKMAEKIDTCKHRSEQMISYQHKTCCRTETRQGFKCLLLEVIPLNPEICQQCNKWEEKATMPPEPAAGI